MLKVTSEDMKCQFCELNDEKSEGDALGCPECGSKKPPRPLECEEHGKECEELVCPDCGASAKGGEDA